MMAHSGPIAPWSLSAEAIHALDEGDIQSLLCINKRRWGGLVMMADPPDDDDDDDDDKDDDDTGDDGGDSGSDDDGDDKEDKVSRADYDAIKKRMRAADKRADEAAAALKKAEDAKKDDLTKATDEAEELKKQVAELTETVSKLRLQNAFLTSNKHSWHDADTALDIAQSKQFLDDVVSDDGEVDKVALGKALDRLAKDHAYLVKTEEKKKEPDEPSGEPAGSRSKNSKDAKREQEALTRRFPVLNR